MNMVGDGAEEMGGTEWSPICDLTHSAGSLSLLFLPPDHEYLKGSLSCSSTVTTLWHLGCIQ